VPPVTHEFHLSITPVARQQDNYLIRTEAMEKSVPLAETQVQWPVDEWLEAARCLGHDPLGQLLAGEALPTGNDPQGAPGVALGKVLYQALFQGTIRDSWLAARVVALHCRQQLRLRLWLKDSRLQRLPWELLYGDDRSLATGTDITLARFSLASGVADLAAMPPLPDGHQPLRVLVVISAPNDEERLALRQEVQNLRADLDRSAATQGEGALPMELTILEQPGRPDLVQALEQGQFQVLHYAGHSDVSENGGHLYLVNRDTGLKELLSGDDLAGLLVNNGIRLTVFNSCRGAYLPEDLGTEDTGDLGWREQNLVQALVNRGVPGVIGMAERIPDHVAIQFTRLLYLNLHKRHPIDVSLSRTRQGLMTAFGAEQPCWMLPILYLRPDFDGYLHQGQYRQVDPLQAMLQDHPVDGHSALDPAEALAADVLASAASSPDEGDVLADLIAQGDAIDPGSPPDSTSALGRATDPDPAPDLAADLVPDPEDGADLAAMVQRLSAPASGDVAPPGEDLRPQWQDRRAFPQGLPPRPAEDPPHGAPSLSSASTAGGRVGEGRWLGLGLGVGAVGVAGLALGAGLWLGQGPIGPSDGPPPATDNGAGETVQSLVDRGLAAARDGNLGQVGDTMAALLDRNQLVAARQVLTALPAEQQIEADLAFVRGRLAWQEGRSDVIDEVARAWQRAAEQNPDSVENLVAWGFSEYARYKVYGTEYGTEPVDFLRRAIDIWEQQALPADRNQGQASGAAATADGTTGLANPITAHGLAGLVMAYTARAEEDPAAQQEWLAVASEYRDRIDRLDPTTQATVTDPQQVCAHWLWQQPNIREDWLEILGTTSAIACPPD